MSSAIRRCAFPKSQPPNAQGSPRGGRCAPRRRRGRVVLDVLRAASERPDRLDRHASCGSPRELRLRSRADARARPPCRQRAPIHTGHDGGTPHAAGPRVAVHGTFPTFHGVRDNGQFYLADEQTTLAEVFKGQGYRTGRLRRRVRPGPPLGDRTGLRHLLRQLRPLEVRAGGRDRRRPAAGGRGRVARHGLAERAVPPAFLRVGAPVKTRTRPTRRPSRSRPAFRRRCMAPTTPRWHSWTHRSAVCSTRSAMHATRPSWWSRAIMANRLASTRSSSTGSSSTTRSRRCP